MSYNKRIKNYKKAIQATKGLIFKAMFVKDNGETRTMLARIGVRKGLTGKGKGYKYDNRLTVYDMQKQAFRTIPLDRLLELKMFGQTWVLW